MNKASQVIFIVAASPIILQKPKFLCTRCQSRRRDQGSAKRVSSLWSAASCPSWPTPGRRDRDRHYSHHLDLTASTPQPGPPLSHCSSSWMQVALWTANVLEGKVETAVDERQQSQGSCQLTHPPLPPPPDLASLLAPPSCRRRPTSQA